MLCCDITQEFKRFCPGVPGGYCYGTVYQGQNTITPVQLPPNPGGWTDESFYVPQGHMWRCTFYPPECNVLSPSGCSVGDQPQTIYCVGLLPDEENGELCDGM
jgi:hypothetical protein